MLERKFADGKAASFEPDSPAGTYAGKRCVEQTAKNKKAKACSLTLTLTTLTVKGRDGASTLAYKRAVGDAAASRVQCSRARPSAGWRATSPRTRGSNRSGSETRLRMT